MKPRKPFLLRLDPALHAAIEQWAEQELRSVNGQIEWILRRAVQERLRRELPETGSEKPSNTAASPDTGDSERARGEES